MTKCPQTQIDLDRVLELHALYYRNGRPYYGSWYRQTSPRERDVLRVLWRALPSVRQVVMEQAADAEFRALPVLGVARRDRSSKMAMKSWDRAVARLDDGARARLATQRRHLVGGVGRQVDRMAEVRVALCDEAGLTPTQIARVMGAICGEPDVAGSARLRTAKSIERARARAGKGPAIVTPIRTAGDNQLRPERDRSSRVDSRSGS